MSLFNPKAKTLGDVLETLKQIERDYPQVLKEDFALHVYDWDNGETSVYDLEEMEVSVYTDLFEQEQGKVTFRTTEY